MDRWVFGCLLGLACLMVAAVIAFVPRAHAGQADHSRVHSRVGSSMIECGVASWYSYTGRRTASGRMYTGREMTAAHRTLAFGSRVRVTDMRTGRSIVVVIDDRGPFVRGRVIDLSPVARRALGMGGLAKVCLTNP
jgi:rare lipoprotein A